MLLPDLVFLAPTPPQLRIYVGLHLLRGNSEQAVWMQRGGQIKGFVLIWDTYHQIRSYSILSTWSHLATHSRGTREREKHSAQQLSNSAQLDHLTCCFVFIKKAIWIQLGFKNLKRTVKHCDKVGTVYCFDQNNNRAWTIWTWSQQDLFFPLVIYHLLKTPKIWCKSSSNVIQWSEKSPLIHNKKRIQC